MKKTISTALVLLLILSTTTGVFATGTISGMHLPNRAIGVDNFGHVPQYYKNLEIQRFFRPSYFHGRGASGDSRHRIAPLIETYTNISSKEVTTA